MRPAFGVPKRADILPRGVSHEQLCTAAAREICSYVPVPPAAPSSERRVLLIQDPQIEVLAAWRIPWDQLTMVVVHGSRSQRTVGFIADLTRRVREESIGLITISDLGQFAFGAQALGLWVLLHDAGVLLMAGGKVYHPSDPAHPFRRAAEPPENPGSRRVEQSEA